MTTLPSWGTPYALSRGGTPIPQGGGFTWQSMVRRGLGQDNSTTTINLPGFDTLPTQVDSSSYPTSPQAATPGFNWNAFSQGLITAGAPIAKMFASYANPIYNLAPGTYYQQTPYGTTVSTAGIPGSVASSLTSSNMMPILLIGGGLLLVMMMARK